MVEARDSFFAGTVAPHEALGLLSLWMEPEIAAPALIKRLGHSLIHARASSLTIRVNGSVQAEARLFDVPGSYWTEIDLRADAPFWKTGDVSFRAGDDAEYALFGVRFVTQGIESWRPKPPDPAPTSNPIDGKPPPSPSAYQRWRDVFLATHGDRYTEAEALRSARAQFPDNRVTRSKVRDLIPPQKPGKPISRRKNGE